MPRKKQVSKKSPKDRVLTKEEAKRLKRVLIQYDTEVLGLSLKKAKKWAAMTVKAFRDAEEEMGNCSSNK